MYPVVLVNKAPRVGIKWRRIPLTPVPSRHNTFLSSSEEQRRYGFARRCVVGRFARPTAWKIKFPYLSSEAKLGGKSVVIRYTSRFCSTKPDRLLIRPSSNQNRSGAWPSSPMLGESLVRVPLWLEVFVHARFGPV